MPEQKLTSKKRPRYLEIADKLRIETLDGVYSNSGEFPTESVLCNKFKVSRFTIREALRTLTEEGLITRKHGSGTVVQPMNSRAGILRQPLSNVCDILQHAQGTTVRFEKMLPQYIPSEIVEKIGTIPKHKWFMFYGKRFEPGRKKPIAVTVAWVNPDLADTVNKIDINGSSLFQQIEERSNITISKVTQDIQAVGASNQHAADLDLKEGDPALRILRCYFDENNKMFEMSASYHPGEKFAYSMHIEVG